MPQRWFTRDKLITDPKLVLVASSQATGLPPSYLTDPMRRKPWRTETGWTFGDWNSRFVFNRGGTRTATLSGTYATPVAVATALVAAMNAADPGAANYNCTYNVAAADTFRVFHNTGTAFTIQAATGSDAWRSGWQCLGFDTADLASASSHVAPDPSYQSRHFLTLTHDDFSVINAMAAGVLDHTAVKANADTDLESKITLRAWFFSLTGAPDVSVPFADLHDGFGGSVGDYALNPCLQILNAGSPLSMFQYQFLIDDVQNPLGYFQAGGLPLLDYIELEKAALERTLQNAPRDYTRVYRAVDGEKHTRRRPRFSNLWSMKLTPLFGDDRTAWLEYANQMVAGDDFYLQLDTTDPKSVMYGSFVARPVDQYVSHALQELTFQIEEAL